MSKIVKAKNGQYCQRIYYRKDDGSKSQKRIYGSTLRELKLKVAEFQLHQESRASTFGSLTLADALEQAAERTYNVLAPNTIANLYATMRRIDPFGKTLLSQIDNSFGQSLVNQLACRYKVSTIRHTIGVVNIALEPYDIRLKVKYPKETTLKEVYIPSDEEFHILQDAIKGTKFELPVLLGGYCGLRKGEVFALTYDDFKGATVVVSKTISRTLYDGYISKPPKTIASNRTIPLPGFIDQLVTDRKSKGQPLFSITYEGFNEAWGRFLKNNGFKHLKFHSLRHYYASSLLKLGIPSRYAIELTGHSSVTTLEKVYQHTMADHSAKMEALLRQQLFKELDN